MKHLTLLLTALAILSSACDPTVSDPAPIQYVARLIFPDTRRCESAVASQAITWDQCHSFLRNIDSHGTPVTTNYESFAYRPLRAYVNLRYLKYNLSGLPVVCDERTIQTDLDGNLRVPLEPCGEDGIRAVIGRVYLQYAIMNADHSRRGFVRTLWEHDRATDLFPLTDDDYVQDGHGFTVRNDDGTSTNYAVPELVFKTELTGDEGVGTIAAPHIINGGTKVFLRNDEEGSDEYGYMRQVVSAHNTLVELHERLRTNFAAAGREEEYFDNVFITDGRYGSLFHYNVWLTANWAFGFRGGISLYRPDLAVFNEDANEDGNPDGARVFGVARLLSQTDTLAHEFGHSVHAALAGSSFNSDYNFSNPMKTLTGTDYDWGHGGSQLQEMGMAFSEGIANSFGQYMFNQCNGSVPSRRPLTVTEPWAQNMWSGDVTCDTDDQNACSAHHIRWHLMRRGLGNGDSTYNTRLGRLQSVVAAGASGNRLSWVTSNNEFRYGEFGCDLLDSDTSVEHSAPTLGASYFSDYTYTVSRIFNGHNETPAVATYAASVDPENVQITLSQLFEAANAFCTDCTTRNNDLVTDDYSLHRIKALSGSLQSPQALGAYLVSRGWATSGQVRNLLQSDFMETQ